MKKKSSCSQSAFVNVRVLIGLSVFMAGVFLALVSFGTFSSVFAQSDSKGATTRGEMTLILAQTLGVYQPPPCVAGSEMFTDMPASNPFCPFIEELARRGITAGCTPTMYCPAAAVTRQQMAPFLIKTQFPTVVPAGLTLAGQWGFDIDSDGTGDWGTSISYPVPMPSILLVQFLEPGALPTPECPGSVDAPDAAPGFLCVYANELVNLDFSDTAANTRFGINFYFNTLSSGDNYANGTWAATAP
jgi:hypothetical protein